MNHRQEKSRPLFGFPLRHALPACGLLIALTAGSAAAQSEPRPLPEQSRGVSPYYLKSSLAQSGPRPLPERSGANAPAPAGLDTNSLPVIDLGNGRLRIHSLIVEPEKRTVRIPARINMTEGLIEYVLVCNDGKTHESLLTTDAEPYHVHVAMLLLGARGAPMRKPGETGDTNTLKGDTLNIRLEWKAGEKQPRHRAESLIVNENDRKPLSEGPWIYNGSWIFNGRFVVQQERSLVSIISDPAALVNNPRPGRVHDDVWLPRKDKLPPIGTPVQVVLELVKIARHEATP